MNKKETALTKKKKQQYHLEKKDINKNDKDI